MGRLELNSGDVPIEQKPAVNLDTVDRSTYEGDVVIGEKIEDVDADYLAELAFMEEPVTIILHQSNERNAATMHPFWNNGKKAEVFQNGRWIEVGHLPVGHVMVIKRKILEQIIRCKIDTIDVQTLNQDSERPINIATPRSSPVHSYTIIEDKNPRGRAWVSEMMRRNF